MSDTLGTFPHFRLNFEQQGKRAKELLKAARDGEPDALARFEHSSTGERASPRDTSATLKLADAQRVIARELRFDDWAALKRHIARMSTARVAIQAGRILDADARTLHVRCGSDIRDRLKEAGFQGDFYEHNYPYLIGPVRDGTGALEERARFIADSHAGDFETALRFDAVLQSLQHAEELLLASAGYDRVVVWSEFDCYDQLVLVRLLGHYATHARPGIIELVNSGDFPGATRFIGLGQLPPEALRLLWTTRQLAGPAQLVLGNGAWRALASPDPRALAAIARGGTPALPLLAPALLRHLRELPSTANGLSFTQQLVLELLAETPQSLNRLFGRMVYERDPLPGQGDLQLRDRVLAMDIPDAALFAREPGVDREGRARPPWTDVLTLTDLGRRVLAGDVDFQSLGPPPRWVGGVRIAPGEPDWRWDEASREAVCRK